MCNNMFDCVEKQSKENEESFKYNGENGYTIKTTQISSEYTDINLSPIIRAWELSEDNDGKCPYFCSQCNLNGECTRCGTNYKIVNNICEEKVENCEEYNSNEECRTCKTNYVFVDGNKNNCLEKSELDSQKYFQDPVDSNNYIACSTAIQNCEKCTDSTHCTKCKTNFGIINDNSAECIDLSSNEYYLDSDGKYKLCSSLLDLGSCQKCLKDSDNINCIECTIIIPFLFLKKILIYI